MREQFATFLLPYAVAQSSIEADEPARLDEIAQMNQGIL
jgi:hypothetical protein